jgi:undecaprenyl-diphosphatase
MPIDFALNPASYSITTPVFTPFHAVQLMSWIEIIVLAIVQGLTEFIPVSSNAHLRIVPAFVGWQDPGAAFTAVLQIGTLAAVLSYYWRDIVRILRAMITDIRHGKIATTHDAWMGWMIGVGTLPIVVMGLLFKKHIETTWRSLWIVSAAMGGVAILLGIAEWYVRRRALAGARGRDVEQVTWTDSFVAGVAQTAALVPGTSRSGSTILGGLICGLSREAAAEFSFLLSIPAVFGAGVFEFWKSRHELMQSGDDAVKLLAALVIAGVVGYATIPWLLGYLRKHTMWLFIVYRLAMAALLVYLLATGKIAAS